MSGETLRAIHERCKARHERDFPWTECKWCKFNHPCPDYSDAVVALALLPDDQHVWIPDYLNPGTTTSFTGFGIDPAPYGHRGYQRYILVPDPDASRVAPAPPATTRTHEA